MVKLLAGCRTSYWDTVELVAANEKMIFFDGVYFSEKTGQVYELVRYDETEIVVFETIDCESHKTYAFESHLKTIGALYYLGRV